MKTDIDIEKLQRLGALSLPPEQLSKMQSSLDDLAHLLGTVESVSQSSAPNHPSAVVPSEQMQYQESAQATAASELCCTSHPSVLMQEEDGLFTSPIAMVSIKGAA